MDSSRIISRIRRDLKTYRPDRCERAGTKDKQHYNTQIKVDSINQKRLIAFINHFVTHTVGFLNRFSSVCEEKLETLSNRLQQLEITMNLLDAKISSIPGLENVTAPASSSSSAPATQQQQPPDTTQGSTAPPAPPPPTGDQPPSGEAPPPPAEETPAVSNPVSKDPRYMKYFKMMQVGVPEGALRNKMLAEGLDPDYLSTPDAPAPPGGSTKKDDDFSDDDDDADDSDDFD